MRVTERVYIRHPAGYLVLHAVPGDEIKDSDVDRVYLAGGQKLSEKLNEAKKDEKPRRQSRRGEKG